MYNETGNLEFLESQILGIPMVAIVTSRVRSLRDPTQQDFIRIVLALASRSAMVTTYSGVAQQKREVNRE